MPQRADLATIRPAEVLKVWQCSSLLLRRLILDALKIMPARCTRSITTSTCRPGSLALRWAKGHSIERPADVLKVWPTREPMEPLAPAQFNRLLDQLCDEALPLMEIERQHFGEGNDRYACAKICKANG